MVVGFVRVSNVAYHKEVTIRYTADEWATFHDVKASYLEAGEGGLTDLFQFELPFQPAGGRVTFAICYRVDGVEYWDNNDTEDYTFVHCT